MRLNPRTVSLECCPSNQRFQALAAKMKQEAKASSRCRDLCGLQNVYFVSRKAQAAAEAAAKWARKVGSISVFRLLA